MPPTEYRKETKMTFILLFLRLSLALTLLSAVADRFGLWGELNNFDITWGGMNRFHQDVEVLTPWLFASAIPALSWFVTILELLLGIALLLNYKSALAALLSGVLFLIFALSMSFFLSTKLMINFNVLVCSASAFLLWQLEKARTSPRP
ncbi:DoxX family protein [Alcaligenes faecalis]|uniref:DoxX family protein n=2 Tax=Alcaligenes faecalis TaxID=511 RepID=UPI00293300E1|nr:DoxX family protein [Alcaligenes faecalis]